MDDLLTMFWINQLKQKVLSMIFFIYTEFEPGEAKGVKNLSTCKNEALV